MSEHANEALLRRAVDLFSQWEPARTDDSYAPEAVARAVAAEPPTTDGASTARAEIEGPISGALWFMIGSVTFLVLSGIGTSVVYALVAR